MAVTKPTVLPRFASVDLLNGTGGAPNVLEPSSGKKDSGWNEGERPPRETFNWLHRFTHDWIEYLDCQVVGAASANHFAEDTTATSGLNFAVGPGKATVGGDEFETVSNTVLALVDDAVNFVWLDVKEDGVSSAFSVMSVDESTVPSELDGDNGVTSILPLFRVTTVAGAITATVDLRTWVTIPFTDYDRLNTRNFTGAGKGAARVAFGVTEALPDPDLAVSNFFLLSPNATPGAIVFQTPDNPGVTNKTDPLWIAIELNDASQSVTWSSAYNFVGDSSNGAIDGADGLSYLATGFYDPTLLEWKMTLTGGTRSFIDVLAGVNGAKVFNTVAQSIPDNVETAVTYGGEAYDTNSFHAGGSPTRLTVPSGVTRFRLTGQITWAPNGSSFRRIEVRKNGVNNGAIDDDMTTFFTQIYASAANASVPNLGMQFDTGIIRGAATDFFEVFVFQNAGVAVSLVDEQNWFQIEAIG